MVSPMSFKDSIAIVGAWNLRIRLGWKYGGQDIGHLFQQMKWALEDHEERFDKHFPPPDLNTEEGRKAEEMLDEFLATWDLDMEGMETEDFLASLMHIFNNELEPEFRLKDFDSNFIRPGSVWKTMEAFGAMIDRAIPPEPVKDEPKWPEKFKFPTPLVITRTGRGGKKKFRTGRAVLKKRPGIAQLRRQRQRKEWRYGTF
ncbi:hypothetical protein QBC41DRAFT_229915 [Cercophora samala]|uniref:Uncharacterized protein n=1 Tax=Cercophora samala TaxID=330535 RepID=A0AA39Z9G8_9PEZI|nr:hypothetical protein QBC41DRAFT_229915 [Cercophora samala]